MRYVILSGCHWSATGGGQRPPQLARQLARRGHEVVHYSCVETAPGLYDGVKAWGPREWRAHEADLRHGCGIAVVALPQYLPEARRLVVAGWTLVYDLIDDWDAFAAQGDMASGLQDEEAEVVALASGVVCSAHTLVAKARRLGATRILVVPNGGPEEPVRVDRAPGSTPRLVYCGYLVGSWLDRALLAQLASDQRLELGVIGDPGSVEPVPGAVYHGELDYASALRAVAGYDVGLVPFRGPICHAVDPIKAYDYWACGLWTVATPDVEPLHGRPWTIVADAVAFPDACLEAAERGRTEPVPAEYVAQNAWSRRAATLDDFCSQLEPAVPTLRSSAPLVVDLDFRLRCTWEAPASCNADPPCPYCSNRASRDRQEALPGDPQEWLAGWHRLESQRGPMYLTACYGDALSNDAVLAVMADLAERNLIDLSTNLIAPVSALAGFPRNGHVRLPTSFHPHLWRRDPALFLAKRREVEASGLHCGLVLIVGYPPYLGRIARWRDYLESEGCPVDLLPFYGVYDGRMYPDAYTVAEWGLLGYPPERTNFHTRPSRGLPCCTGSDYIFVTLDGTVRRCFHPAAEVLGSIFDQELTLWSEARPCPVDYCTCAGLWHYIDVAE